MIQAAATFDLLRHFNPLRLTGPLFDKELRVASRRIRYYALRTGYAAVLAFLVMVTWSSTVRTGSAVVLASRMPEVAKTVTTAITWLQFFAAQGLAVILLSSAIGEEIRKGTLSALLTTPITSFQIVIGKLLSRMLQVLVLLAMSLPVMAILRLLGGVPWEYVLAGGCVTLTTTLFVGALSLWLSTYYRYGSKAISTAVLLVLVLFIIPSAMLHWMNSLGLVNTRAGTWAEVASILDLISPFIVLYEITDDLWSPGISAAGAPWGLNSLIMLGLTLLLLSMTIWRVRKAAVAAMSGPRKSAGAVVGRAVKRLLWNAGKATAAAGPVKHVTGSPVVWKETRRGVWYGWSLSDIAICSLALTGAVVPFWLVGLSGGKPMGLGLFIAWCLSILLVIRLAVECAGNVPREREARTWPILLMTLLEDKEIVNGKAKAALLRNAPLLITMAVITLFLFVVFPRPETLLAAGWGLISQVASILLAIGIGSYFGVTIKTRMSAVVATIALCLTVKYGIGWIFLPVAGVIAMGSGGAVWGFFLGMIVPCVIHVTIGVAAIRVAAQRVRHEVF